MYRIENDTNMGVGEVLDDEECYEVTYRQQWITEETKWESEPVLDFLLLISTFGIVRYKDRKYGRFTEHTKIWKENTCEPEIKYDEHEESEVVQRVVQDTPSRSHKEEWFPLDEENQGLTIFGKSLDWWEDHSTIGDIPVTIATIPLDNKKTDNTNSNPDQESNEPKSSKIRNQPLTSEPISTESVDKTSMKVDLVSAIEHDTKQPLTRLARTDFNYQGFANVDGMVFTGKDIKTLFLEPKQGKLGQGLSDPWLQDDKKYRIRIDPNNPRIQRLNPSVSGSTSLKDYTGSRTVQVTYGYLTYLIEILSDNQ